MKAIAIDDEMSGLEVIRSHADKVSFLEIKAEFVNAFEALRYLQTEKIDLIFLDISMPDISGIEFYKSLNQKPLLIFTTAYSEHAAASFELDAVDYLLKPFSLTRFLKSCNKAYELFNYRGTIELPETMFVKEGIEQIKIRFDQIIYLEASGNYVIFFLKDRQITSRTTFLEVRNILPEEKFIRIHRSFIVAFDKVTKYDRFQVWIEGKRIPFGKAYRKEFENMINNNQ